MQTASFSVIPVAPARSTSGAVRAGGPTDAEAAGGAFAGLLAAATPEADATAGPDVEEASVAGADGSVVLVGAGVSLPLADAAVPVATPEAPAVSEAHMSPETALPTAAIQASLAVASAPVTTPVDSNAQIPTPTADASPVAPAAGAVTGAEPAPDVAADQTVAADAGATKASLAATSPSTGLAGTDLPAGGPAVPNETGAPLTTAMPAPAPDDPARLAAALPSGMPTTGADQPVVVAAASEAAEPGLPQPAIAPGQETDAPEVREAADEPASHDESNGKNESNDPNETAEAQDLSVPADAKPAALQALLGLGLQTYLKAEAAAGSRLPAMQAADPTASGGTAGDRIEGQVATGRPAAFVAAIDTALAGLATGGDSSSEDTLMALTGVGRTRAAPGADAASSIRSQVTEQIARGLASGRGEDKLTIRLNPENLGRVDVDFSPAGDRLTVVMRASTPEAEQALRAGARELTDGILERAARYQHVEVRVELRDGSAGRITRQDERQQDERADRQDKNQGKEQDGKQDGRRDGRADGRGRHPDAMFDGAKSAWARAMADLTQEG